MKTGIAFWKKEWMDLVRSGKAVLLLLIASLFGIMNPAIAKLTPWLMETMSESLQETGLHMTEVTVDAMTSWVQFYKNMPMELIIIVLLLGGIFTQEYQKGTLVMVLTKGLKRRSVYLAKTFMCALAWSVCFWLSFFITWLYNDYFWNNGIAEHLIITAALFWLFGLWIFFLLVFFSAVAKETTGVLAGTGMILLISYIAGMFPKIQEYLPTKLLEAQTLLTESAVPGDFYKAIAVVLLLNIAAVLTGMILFDKKNI